ncbi:MAG: SHOCT domain-containing protein [Halofilum sp. (in: g-proteobacteria)]|nr:SHOCT domain-containing protein [Halofilum sp. (in: g-proteobacteria)]
MMGGSGWFMGPIMMLLFLALVVGVVVLAVRWSGGVGGDIAGSPRQGGSRARAILEERFARGEIDEEEFRKRKQALEE